MNDTSILEAYEAQKKVIQAYKHKDEWLKALLSNPTLNPTDKLILIETTPEPIKMGLPFDFEQAEAKKLYINGLAENIGISNDTFGSRLERLSRQGDTFKYDRRREPAEDGTPVLRVLVTPSPVLATPQAIALPQKGEGHGGKRTKKCSACGSDNLVEKRQILCAECGTLQSETIHIVNSPENAIPQDDVWQQSPIPQDDVWQSESQERREPSGNLTDISVDTLSCILAELRNLPIWCCHRAKVPYIAESMKFQQKAKSNDSSTWRTVEQAQALYERSHKEGWKEPFDGIGFMCTGDFTVVDYDHCIENGKIDELVLSRIQAIDSYAEVSPSGTGIHQIARGTLPRNIKQPGCEMYDHLRFVTFTGQHLAMTPETIEDRQEQLTALHTEIAPAPAEPREVQQKRDVSTQPGTCSDEEVLSKARGAANSAKFVKLWEGDASDYRKKDGSPDWSRADLALCRMLAYYSDGDENAIDRLFKQSKLYREKWERDDYREKTISKAVGGQIAS